MERVGHRTTVAGSYLRRRGDNIGEILGNRRPPIVMRTMFTDSKSEHVVGLQRPFVSRHLERKRKALFFVRPCFIY